MGIAFHTKLFYKTVVPAIFMLAFEKHIMKQNYN